MSIRNHVGHVGGIAGGLAGVVLGLALVGCNQKELPEGFAPAFGTVTLDGKPVKDAEVIFVTEKGESYGRTDANGYYQMERTRTLTGAGLGPATVKISTTAVFDDMSPEGLEFSTEDEDYVRKETIPRHYADGIEIVVTKDGAPYDFELTSTPETTDETPSDS